MTALGMIHLSCLCEADLFYIGDAWDGKPSTDIMNAFRAKLGTGKFGIFSSGNGRYGECPHCGQIFELPDPNLIDWLPFQDEETFKSTIDDMLDSLLSKNGSLPQE